MKRARRFRLALAMLALAGIVSAPLPASALGGAPPIEESVVGACMAIICGGSINVLRVEPHPVVIATAVGACLGAFLDAVFTPDNPGG